jgi:hypothetical protein
MPIALILALAVHVLSAVFWAGTTFVLARTGGDRAARLFRPQMGAAVVAVLSGAVLWGLSHRGFGQPEQVLLLGVVCALAAAGVQGALVGRAVHSAHDGAAIPAQAAAGSRIAAALLGVTLICMAVARYV